MTYWTVLILSLNWPVFASIHVTAPCRKNIIPGYKFVRSDKQGDRYQDASKRITLYTKCFPLKTSAEELIGYWKTEANPKNMEAEAVYFEINTETRSKRVYVVTRKPVMQLSFETRWRNRIWLEATEEQVRKVFGKKGQPRFRKPRRARIASGF